jgi:HAD superfamily hydrolase (TIGR01549 family)
MSNIKVQRLRDMNICTAVITNADARIISVLDSLSLTHVLDPVLVSEQEGVEKPAKEIFMRVCERVGVGAEETLHVGDELEA